MAYQLDHVVVWVADPVRSLDFYRQVLGLEPVRAEEYAAGQAPFISVRLGPGTILDLTPLTAAPALNAVPGAAGTAGNLLNHICLAMPEAEFEALHERLVTGGHRTTPYLKDLFGARGNAPRAFYFGDPDGNVFEARYYE
ncbi:VOC family protein [Kitasatospora atroaurantiaca]|uniref:Catechol 2,3-dioxygenase-like lactoylglutathione lyase family enzyme n=1 Tax=Kitasatospora atroaurantiaca TaxID=285545 RepID=A0A561EKF3_9ACTN|nr:VOC family protein [Kitasatospora atroaurantiaca]TWE16093.1 catechol 2,3-dioxygenase-like lactoylglutathione lyase family enzyme [Kitasatospora atroaurantiaca]